MNNLLRSIKIQAFVFVSMAAIYYSAGLAGWGVALYMILLFDIWRQKVHGCSMTEVPVPIAEGYDTPIPWWMYALMVAIGALIVGYAWYNSI